MSEIMRKELGRSKSFIKHKELYAYLGAIEMLLMASDLSEAQLIIAEGFIMFAYELGMEEEE